MSDIYFNADKLPTPKKEYVAFIDIMGTRTHMKCSVKETANFIFKFHAAVIAAYREKMYKNVFLYPVMDGIYITTGKKEDMINILLRVFRELAKCFVNEKDNYYKYLIRGSIAYGEVIHGHHIPYKASKIFEVDLGYKNQIILGSGMITAYDNESMAAPFGIQVDSSAIKMENDSKRQYGAFPSDWKWFKDEMLKIDENLPRKLQDKIINYLNWLRNENNPLHYDKIDRHIELTNNYFQ